MPQSVYDALRIDMKDYDFIFYDFEVFSYDWMVVLYSEQGRTEICIRNNSNALRAFFRTHLNKCIWVGWNCRAYDAYILKSILCGENPKKVSDYIIKEGNPGYKYNSRYADIHYINYDAMNNCRVGLKTVEGAVGCSIEETEVPFDIGRPLTAQELDMTERYCRHDVEQTRHAFIITHNEFESDMSLIDTFGLNRQENIGRTRRDLVSIILKASKKDFGDAKEYRLPNTLRLTTPKYREAAKWFLTRREKSARKEVIVGGIPHTYADGGLHGCRADTEAQRIFLSNCKTRKKTPTEAQRKACRFHMRRAGCLIDMDAFSFYPSLMLRYNLLPRTIEDPGLFERIYIDRQKFKASGDPRAKPYKIVLNTVYGAMGLEGSSLYDPLNRALVCIYGQVLITDLIEKLENGGVKGFELIQTNTDGIMFAIDNPKELDKAEIIASEWETRTGMKLEVEVYDEIWQKDVNNYFLIGTEEKDGKLETVERGKGSVIGGSYPKSNNLRVVAKAMREYFLHHTKPADYIASDDNLIDFQIVSSIRAPYDYWVKNDIKKRTIMSGKVNRVFASKMLSDGTFGYARNSDVVVGLDGEQTVKTVIKAGGVPDHAFSMRGRIERMGAHTVDKRLDRDWYTENAEELISEFGGSIGASDKPRNVVCSLQDFM